MIIVDASVVVRHLTARSVAERIDRIEGPEATAAPDLLAAEVCNALATMARTAALPAQAGPLLLQQLSGVIDHFFPMQPLAGRAFELAAELRHPAYDCFYLALAEAEQTVLLTADRRLVSRLAGTRYQPLAITI